MAFAVALTRAQVESPQCSLSAHLDPEVLLIHEECERGGERLRGLVWIPLFSLLIKVSVPPGQTKLPVQLRLCRHAARSRCQV